jgi:ribosomal protein S18 acetylase RimI-like enzyme
MTPVEPLREPELRRWLESFGPLTTGLLAQKGLRLEAAQCGEQWQCAVGSRDKAVVYPVFPQAPEERHAQAFRQLAGRLHEQFCLMGPLAWVERAEACLQAAGPGFRRLRSLDYDFLARPWMPPESLEPQSVVRARPRDAMRLFQLQEGYEKEEVLFSPDEFQPVASWLAFQKTLKEQLVMVAQPDNRPAAMARTNARWKHWAQIGGVYTLPSQRRQGLQKHLLSVLLNELARDGQGACLFVKKANVAAFNLYFELGFGDPSDFRISYWVRSGRG